MTTHAKRRPLYFDPRQSRNDLEILLQFGVSAFEPFLCGLRGPTVTGEILQLFRRHHPRLSKDPNQVRVQTAASEPYLGLVQAVSGLLSGLVQALDWPFSGLVALEENLDSTFICLRSSVLFGIVWRSGGSGVTVNCTSSHVLDGPDESSGNRDSNCFKFFLAPC